MRASKYTLMLFLIFLLFYLAPESLTRAIPLSTLFSARLAAEATTNVTYLSNDPSAFRLAVLRDPSICTCPTHQRSVWDIVWSCLATLFACSWVSVHPDVPSPNEKRWRRSLRRIEYLVWTFLMPELIVWWAARQWMGAWEIQKEQKDRGWTVTHGHFLQMGGFMLFKGKERLGTLSYPAFCYLLRQGRIKFPDITQEEIEDRSKSDGLSKTLVIAQTGWFLIQCIARRVQSLPIAELELLTLALAALNGVMYFFWWNKPFDVQWPFPVHLILPTESKVSIPPLTSNNEIVDHQVSNDATPIKDTTDPKICKRGPPSNEDPLLPIGTHRQFPQFNQMCTSVLHWSGWRELIFWPLILGSFLWRRMTEIVSRGNSSAFDYYHYHLDRPFTHGTMHVMVPMFYSTRMNFSMGALVYVIPLMGSLFGAVHCAGWDFQFPTHVELWLWRIFSLYIAIAPLIAPLLVTVAVVLDQIVDRAWANTVSSICAKTLISPVAMAIPLLLYIVARLVLLAESILTLRELPPGVFDVVQWTSFLPHI